MKASESIKPLSFYRNIVNNVWMAFSKEPDERCVISSISTCVCWLLCHIIHRIICFSFSHYHHIMLVMSNHLCIYRVDFPTFLKMLDYSSVFIVDTHAKYVLVRVIVRVWEFD